MIDDLVPGDAWRTIELTGERYLPWQDGWFQKTGLLLLTNGALYLHGMQMVEVYPEYDYRMSVGFDVVGTGAYPMPPQIWSNPAMIESTERMRKLIRPRIDGDT